MLSNVGCGWCTFQFNNFTGSISYLCDPIFQLGELFLSGNGVTTMDEEGNTFDVVVSEGYYIYVVNHCDGSLYTKDTTIEECIKELINDIKDNLVAWVDWYGYCEDDPIEEMRAERMREINELLEKLRKQI